MEEESPSLQEGQGSDLAGIGFVDYQSPEECLESLSSSESRCRLRSLGIVSKVCLLALSAGTSVFARKHEIDYWSDLPLMKPCNVI